MACHKCLPYIYIYMCIIASTRTVSVANAKKSMIMPNLKQGNTTYHIWDIFILYLTTASSPCSIVWVRARPLVSGKRKNRKPAIRADKPYMRKGRMRFTLICEIYYKNNNMETRSSLTFHIRVCVELCSATCTLNSPTVQCKEKVWQRFLLPEPRSSVPGF